MFRARKSWSLVDRLTWVSVRDGQFGLILIGKLGFTNSSLYHGDIDYVALPTRATYWILSLSCWSCTLLERIPLFILFFTSIERQ